MSYTFSRTQQTGYGAVAYLRHKPPNGGIFCHLLIGKARVAPLKFVTITRMELTAAVVAARISAHLAKEIDVSIHRTVLWTDSTIVLRYLTNNSARSATFVANRVGRILELSNVEQ